MSGLRFIADLALDNIGVFGDRAQRLDGYR